MPEKEQPGSAHERLLRRYLDSLPGKRAEIAERWARVRSGDWDEEAIGELKRPVHRLAGSAGSYGLEDLGRAAAALDRLLGSVREDARSRASVSDGVRALLEQFDRAMRPED